MFRVGEDDAYYFAPWEWQPIEYVPDGCNEIFVRYVDNTVKEMCSCDYWWNRKEPDQPYSFRYK